ncbi:DNA starvation/stationary phase protection protein [Paenibacillus albicereus]|uniref:DNA starvation/stationary phase protection protein n=2 Tax=Paenibacillus albicereus TaxID=2726185 RepID=A0A6H2H4F4_9BACL|nr:DNA starvation/stationary phase protection protein [Paenibacillus albicereus]
MTKTNPAETASVHAALNLQLANWSVLYAKLQQYHWLVKGPHFFTLHAKFQELYEDAAARVDELAERVLATGGRPLATMREFLDAATLEEGSGDESAIEMVLNVASDYRTLAQELGHAIADAEHAGDGVTADLLLGIRESIEKHAWMLEAFASA